MAENEPPHADANKENEPPAGGSLRVGLRNTIPPVIPHPYIPSYLTKVQHVKRSKYYTKDDVAEHSSTKDAWLTVRTNVLNVSDLTDNSRRELTLEQRTARSNLTRWAGKDVSHWFKNKPYPFELRDRVNPEHGGQRELHLPQGLIPHTQPHAPVTNYETVKGGHRRTEWWNQIAREVGKMTRKMRKIHIVNMIFCSEPRMAIPELLLVSQEDTLNHILFRYLHRNRHAGSYTFKFDDRVLDMNKTLEDNGIEDEEVELKSLDMDVDQYLPVLHLYFNDDLTEA